MRTVQLGRDASTQVSHENKVDTAMKDADIKYSVKEKAGLEKSVRGKIVHLLIRKIIADVFISRKPFAPDDDSLT